jgi:hypothetical protein
MSFPRRGAGEGYSFIPAWTCRGGILWFEEFASSVGSQLVVSCKLLGWSVLPRDVRTLESFTATTAFPSIRVSCPGCQFVIVVAE